MLDNPYSILRRVGLTITQLGSLQQGWCGCMAGCGATDRSASARHAARTGWLLCNHQEPGCKEGPKLSQIIEAISRDGYVVAQEYLPEAVNGDVRLIVMNGQPLLYEGKYAAFRRTNKSKDIRSNMSAGGIASKVTVTDEMWSIVEVVRPKLVSDGMFLVGLDIVGDKLMEINVFSPGGLGSAESLYDVNFAPAIIEELQRKVSIRQHYPETDNRSLATG
jgi:glutathione synthase